MRYIRYEEFEECSIIVFRKTLLDTYCFNDDNDEAK
jgi:hypothetical protein